MATNYGTATTLRTDNSPDLHSYLRSPALAPGASVDVQGLTGNVTSATLRIYANSASSAGYTVYSVSDNTWTETGITYSNAPALGSSLGSSGTFSANAWTTVDVTAYISGNGVYNLAFSTTSSTNVSYSSREGANAPQLVIQTSSGPTNMPTFTPTSGPTPTRTNTPGPTATNTPTATPAPPFSNATFVYDGDGKRVKSTFNGTLTTYFVGSHYEVTGSTITKYYYAGAQRIAMRTNGTLNYLLGDHLGSTSLTTNASGQVVSELRYKAWGEVRFASGNIPTKYQYTGQFSYEAEFGLYFYGARWYDDSLGRFNQPDTIIPQKQGTQAWDRYAYTSNNPARFADPTGHQIDDGCHTEGCSLSEKQKNDDAQKLAILNSQTNRHKCENGNKAYCSDQSDAHFKSLSGSLGAGSWFVTYSYDIVTTEHEVGVFFSYGTGPTTLDAYTGDFRGLNDFDSTFMTPQAGATFWSGRLYGEFLEKSVDNYSGPALQAGGSGGPFSFETFSSVDKDTGMMDTKIIGEAYGVGVSVQPAEVHVNYAKAVNLKPLSYLATLSCKLMGSCTP